MSKIRLAIADDQLLFRRGLRSLLARFEEIDILLEVANGVELLAALAREEPDVILMDLRMPEMDGLEATEKIRQLYPEVKIILLTTYDEEHLINYLMKVGANGYLLKNEEPDVLRQAVHAVVEKGFYFNDHVSQALLSGLRKKHRDLRPWKVAENLRLTPREIEILELICQARTSSEIAEELYISVRTVENHRKSLLAKTGTRNVAGLIVYAVREGLVELKG